MVLRLVAFLLAFGWPMGLLADPVVLTSQDGETRIEGELLSIRGELFRIMTAHGALTLDAGGLSCAGAGCPSPEALVARARFTGPAGMVHNLVPTLLDVFAEQQGFDFRAKFLSDRAVNWWLHAQDTGQVVAAFQGRVTGDPLAEAALETDMVTIALGRDLGASTGPKDVIALDAVVPLVAPENPRAMVTEAQLSALLSGKIGNWARLGGADLPVTLHLLAGSERLLADWQDGPLAAQAETHATPTHLSDRVASDPSALGVGLYSAIRNAAPLVVGGACGLAIPATRDTIRAEDYPLTQPLFLQRIGDWHPKILRDFVAFVLSPEAQPVIAASGYVDQSISRIGFDRQGDRIANAVLAAGEDGAALLELQKMIATLVQRDRLTLTFRFQDGSSDLDAQSASNIGRLARAIRSGEFNGKTLHFIGFSDGNGSSEGNQRLSLRRARSVRDAVRTFAPDALVALKVTAFGERLPMACDDTIRGRQVNRRVEVWVDRE